MGERVRSRLPGRRAGTSRRPQFRHAQWLQRLDDHLLAHLLLVRSGHLILGEIIVKFLVALLMLTGCTVSMASTVSDRCDTFSPTDEVSSPLTIEEIEKQAMADLLAWQKQGLNTPNELFGYMNAHWLTLKSMFQPGDEIVRYSTDKLSWQGLRGQRGFALVRSGCIVNRLVTAQS